MAESAISEAVACFTKHFGSEPAHAVVAPGRVNLIGEHVDYCDGFVFPMAIEPCTAVVGSPNGTEFFNITTTANVGDDASTLKIPKDLAQLQPEAGRNWGHYVKGVLVAFASHNVPACDIAISSTVPLGGGLSSSAALEVGVYSFLQLVTQGKIENTPAKAVACQGAEHQYAHVPCGIMDQFVVTMAQEGHALLLDCRSNEFKQVPIRGDVIVVVTNSHVHHQLVDGEYAKRRAACEGALRVISEHNPAVKSWRDAKQEDLEAVKDKLSDEFFRRGRHVISEIARTQEACEAFERDDFAEFGRLMSQSHESLKNDYNVTVPETDKLVELAGEVRGVYGARMTGGGFGGSIVTLCKSSAVSKVIAHLKKGYPEGTSFATKPAGGAHEFDLKTFLEPKKKRARRAPSKTASTASSAAAAATAPAVAEEPIPAAAAPAAAGEAPTAAEANS